MNPIEKRVVFLQWRMIHRAVGMNRHMVHVNSVVGTDGPFCGAEETVQYMFLHFDRLPHLFRGLFRRRVHLALFY